MLYYSNSEWTMKWCVIQRDVALKLKSPSFCINTFATKNITGHTKKLISMKGHASLRSLLLSGCSSMTSWLGLKLNGKACHSAASAILYEMLNKSSTMKLWMCIKNSNHYKLQSQDTFLSYTNYRLPSNRHGWVLPTTQDVESTTLKNTNCSHITLGLILYAGFGSATKLTLTLKRTSITTRV